jgi:DNA-binding FadR family transcriptional regulator
MHTGYFFDVEEAVVAPPGKTRRRPPHRLIGEDLLAGPPMGDQLSEQATAQDAATRCTDVDLLRMDEALSAEGRPDPRTATAQQLTAANRAFHDQHRRILELVEARDASAGDITSRHMAGAGAIRLARCLGGASEHGVSE